MPFTAPSTRNNLGPLTTTFTPAATCTSYGVVSPSANAGGFQGQGCSGGNLYDTSACWPRATVPGPAPGPLVGWGFYSPGLACPTGYVTACTAYGASASPPTITPDASASAAANATASAVSFAFNFPLLPTETAYGCCPAGGFFCAGGAGGVQTCLKKASSTTYPVGTCSGDVLTSFIARTAPQVLTPRAGSAPVTSRTVNLWAPLFQLNMQPTDVGAPAEDAPATAAAPGLTVVTAVTAATAGAEGAGGLAPGVQAAIAVPVALLGLALLLGAAALVWRRRRRRRQQLGPDALGGAGSGAQAAELPHAVWGIGKMHEAGGGPVGGTGWGAKPELAGGLNGAVGKGGVVGEGRAVEELGGSEAAAEAAATWGEAEPRPVHELPVDHHHR